MPDLLKTMKRKLLYIIAGARPNFMKIAPIIRALQNQNEQFDFRIIHTGQHFDKEMSDVFFDELGIPQPDHHLNCGGGSHAEQTAKIMVAFEKICQNERPDCVIVVGDVNSTLACSIVSKKLNISLAHVEAGLRSGDMTMPEEVNRIVTDSISDWYFCTEPSGVENLLKEGKSRDHIFHVGQVMVDNLLYQCDKLVDVDKSKFVSEDIKKKLSSYGVLTLHRPSNVDNLDALTGIIRALKIISTRLPIVFPVHPRTHRSLDKLGLDLGDQIILTTSLSYMDFLNLWKDAVVVLTDSGGLQEETTALGLPCLTLRNNTERPITLTDGTNTLVGSNQIQITEEFSKILEGYGKVGKRPELWDGEAAKRIVNLLNTLLH